MCFYLTNNYAYGIISLHCWLTKHYLLTVEMEIKRVNVASFSAAGTTTKIAAAIERGIGINERQTIDIFSPSCEKTIIPNDKIAIFGVPVFSGRVPAIAGTAINMIKGDHTPAVIFCVYGNRDFDDALLELKELVENNGFYIVSAAAFVAQHSIFSKVAAGRPSADDIATAEEFGKESIKAAYNLKNSAPSVDVKGNFPYRDIKPIPLKPKTNSSCNSCGICANQCPTKAIDINKPKHIDKTKCISCAHCISICPKGAKHFGGLLYRIASRKFAKAYSEHKKPYIVIAK